MDAAQCSERERLYILCAHNLLTYHCSVYMCPAGFVRIQVQHGGLMLEPLGLFSPSSIFIDRCCLVDRMSTAAQKNRVFGFDDTKP